MTTIQMTHIQMTTQACQQLRESRRLYLKQIDKDIQDAEDIVTKLKKECDHLYVDGTSAITNMFLYTQCTICGEDDATL
jgi:hypothetical protein